MEFVNQSLTYFSEELASAAPVPGGGGAAALIGAIGASLGNMVGALTVGKKKYADVEEEIRELMREGETLRKELLSLIDKDAEGFAPLAKAYAIPKDDPDRDAVMEEALLAACAVPMQIMRACAGAIGLMEVFAKKGSRLAVSDAGCGAVACKAAMQAASLNVAINTKSMRDRDKAGALDAEAKSLLDTWIPKADAVFAEVAGALAY